ncbi:MAG TPA: PAS domain S-box protein [Opitutaceae bacterium]|jgi:two-component system cell cycle sensor histidine kinase/response regulator CckA|nr:PAS domain S-box protein [Opitutaceae bacterium]
MRENGASPNIISYPPARPGEVDAASALKQAEAKYRAIFDHAREGILQTTPDGEIITANPAMARILGYESADELMRGAPNIQSFYVNAADRTELQRLLQESAAAVNHEIQWRRRDGNLIWVSVDAQVVRDEHGAQHYHFVAVFDVINERKRAEAALHESEERYRLLFESNPLPMLLFDPETLRFLAVNESFVQHYGYSRGEVLTMTIKDLYLAEDIPALLKCVEEAGATPMKTCEWRHRRKDGTIIQVETISSPLVSGGRNTRLVLATDITEKKLLEEKFLHSQRIESIGMLAAGLAHDLNNVLAPIMLAAPMLRMGMSSPRDLRILDTLEQNAARGAGLVKQILGFAHSTTGDLRPTQVRPLVQDIINIIEETFPKSIILQDEIASDLSLVQGNPTRIHQVLLNLCVNARDAMPQGGTLRIAATNRRLDREQAGAWPGARHGSWLVIEVSDTGTGIAPDVLTHIWDPFFTTKGAEKGTGIGLSTVRGIVASHRGFVTVDTQLGRGTTFQVFLPATDENSADDQASSAVAAPIGQHELILVVDDNDAIRETVTAILTKHNYRVMGAGDGVEAVGLLTSNQSEVALLITDVDIPYLGGAALATIASQLCPDARLLVISGFSNEENDDSPLEAAKKLTHACLLKPFAPKALLETVHQLLHPPINSARPGRAEKVPL